MLGTGKRKCGAGPAITPDPQGSVGGEARPHTGLVLPRAEDPRSSFSAYSSHGGPWTAWNVTLSLCQYSQHMHYCCSHRHPGLHTWEGPGNSAECRWKPA